MEMPFGWDFFFFFFVDEVESMDGIILVGADCRSEKDTGSNWLV